MHSLLVSHIYLFPSFFIPVNQDAGTRILRSKRNGAGLCFKSPEMLPFIIFTSNGRRNRNDHQLMWDRIIMSLKPLGNQRLQHSQWAGWVREGSFHERGKDDQSAGAASYKAPHLPCRKFLSYLAPPTRRQLLGRESHSIRNAKLWKCLCL